MHGSVRLGYEREPADRPRVERQSRSQSLSADPQCTWTSPSRRWTRAASFASTQTATRRVRDSQTRWHRQSSPITAFGARTRIRTPKQLRPTPSTLFDTAAVYLAFTHDFCQMERLGIRVDDSGYTRIDPHAKILTVATAGKAWTVFATCWCSALPVRFLNDPRASTSGQHNRL